MRLYIGGAWQGQEELARVENPEREIIPAFHEIIREEVLRCGRDPVEVAEGCIREHPMAAVVSDEVGSGVVPMQAEERRYREAVGRALCRLAESAESVTRCVCGIGVRIK